MKLMRKRLEIGQELQSSDGKIEGVIIKLWPVENGSEALVKLRTTSDIVQVFISSDKAPAGK